MVGVRFKDVEMPINTRLVAPEQLTGNICVFAAAREASEQYVRAARRMGELIGLHDLDIVYGGIDVGLMHHVTDAARNNGSKVTGVLPTPAVERSVSVLRKLSVLRPKDDTTIHTNSLIDRKHTMLDASDAVVALAGGIGTFDEIATTLELARGRLRSGAASRLVILNTDGYYGGLQDQLTRIHAERFMTPRASELAHFADTPEDAMVYIQNRLGTAYAELGRVPRVEL